MPGEVMRFVTMRGIGEERASQACRSETGTNGRQVAKRRKAFVTCPLKEEQTMPSPVGEERKRPMQGRGKLHVLKARLLT